MTCCWQTSSGYCFSSSITAWYCLLTGHGKSSQTLEVQWLREEGSYESSWTNQLAGPSNLYTHSNGGLMSQTKHCITCEKWICFQTVLVWKQHSFCLMFDPKPSLSDMVWEEGTYMTRTNVNQTTWIPIKKLVKIFLAHPFEGQTKRTLKPAKGGCRFPSLNWKNNFPNSLYKGSLT